MGRKCTKPVDVLQSWILPGFKVARQHVARALGPHIVGRPCHLSPKILLLRTVRVTVTWGTMEKEGKRKAFLV